MSTNTNLKKAAVIGCGKYVEGQEGWAIGHAHGGALRELSDQVEVYGVDLSPENLAAFGERFELSEDRLFASTDSLYEAFTPDVVAICTWPKLHAPMALEAMEKGVKGIVIEKPIALDVGEIDQIIAKAKEVGASVSIAHQRLHEPEFKTYKKVVESGALGTPLNVHAHIGGGWDVLSWTTHWFDMANFLFDSAPKYVLAGMDVTDKRIYQQAVENGSIVFAEYEDEHSGYFLTGPMEHGYFRVSGPKGIMYRAEDEVLVCTDQGVEKHELTPEPYGSFACVYLELFEEMAGGAEAKLSINRCGTATAMAYAAQESARTARKVSLPMETKFPPIEVMQRPNVSALKDKNVLLYADAHFGSGGREGIAEALETLTGRETTVIDAERQGLAAADVESVDVIVIYHTQSEVSDETKHVLSNWVASGRALSIVHAGLGAWPEWAEFQKWCGLIWEWGVSTHPYSPVLIKTDDSKGVAFPYAEGWLPKDEVFIKLKETAELTIDATAEIMESGEVYPAAWHTEAFPNVGCWMPGHLRSSWKVPAMIDGLGAVLRRILK